MSNPTIIDSIKVSKKESFETLCTTVKVHNLGKVVKNKDDNYILIGSEAFMRILRGLIPQELVNHNTELEFALLANEYVRRYNFTHLKLK